MNVEFPGMNGAVFQAIIALTEAGSWSNAKRIVMQSPELLTAEAEEMLQRFAAFDSNPEGKVFLQRLGEVLQRCRVEGIEAAFAPLLQPEIPSRKVDILPGFEAVIQELDMLSEKAQQDPRFHLQRIKLIKDMLSCLQSNEFPTFQGKLWNELGHAYASLIIGNRGENLEQAIAAYLEALRFWTPETAPFFYAMLQTNLGSAYSNLPSGNQTENLQKAISAYQEALRFRTPEAAPYDYALTQNNLGNAYMKLPTGEQTENLRKAIICFKEALRFRTPEAAPYDYALTQNNLGFAYSKLPTGNQRRNLEKAIASYQEALRFWTPEDAPLDYALSQRNLGFAYSKLPIGKPERNLKKAIAAYQEALRFWTPEDAPLDYALTQNDLGNAYADLPTGDKIENLEKAIACFQEALRFWTPEDAPLDYAMTQNNLGIAFSELPTGDQPKNLQKAIACFQEALRFRTPEATPYDYAMTQNNLGYAYNNVRTGDQAENLQKAIACFQEALRFRSPETAPYHYALTNVNLGNAYTDLPTGNRGRNLEKAFAAYQEALRFLTFEDAPYDYAMTQHSLGGIYADSLSTNPENLDKAIAAYQEALRVWKPKDTPHLYATAQHSLGTAYGIFADNQNRQSTGESTAYLEKAIHAYREALRFRTPETAPYDYAMTQNNLGIAYSNLPNGDRRENLQLAINAYEEALRFLSPEASPYDFARVQTQLGHLHFDESHWEQAHTAFASAVNARETLYQIASTEVARQTMLAQTSTVYFSDAYCLARLGRFTETVERLELGKARALAEALAKNRAALQRANPVDRAAFEAARDRIKALETKARAPRSVDSESGDALQFIGISTELRVARQDLDVVIKHIRVYLSDFMPASPNFQVIASIAELGNPLVYLITTTQGSMGFIVPSDFESLEAKHCVWLDHFSNDHLDNLLLQTDADGNTTGGYLIGQVIGDMAILKEESERVLVILREWLMGPLTARLVELGYRQAILIAGGRLSLLPLPATVFEMITLSFAPSALVLQAARQAALEWTGLSPILLGIGNPLPNPQPLDFARTEVEAIAALFSSDAQRLLPEHQTTRANIFENIPGATHLHFACHGAFNLEEPLDSTLSLSGDDTLKLRDLLDGDLDLSKSRLAVLSACQTGITDFRNVPDEAIGFPGGLLQAGVPGVVSTLWPVDDISTALLMIQFYRYHLEKHMEPALALRKAQVWLRNATAEEMQLASYYEKHVRRDPYAFHAMQYFIKHPSVKPFSHPYYWAAFTFTGV